MRNLKLASKMLLLTLLLIASMAVVAVVAVNRLSAVNEQVSRLVSHTLQKKSVAGVMQTSVLASIRAQKNAIMAPDDAHSKEYADQSRSELVDVRTHFDRLRELVAADHIEQQSAVIERLARDLEAFQKINKEVLDLAVQNSNVKARQLAVGDLHRAVDAMTARYQSWIEQAGGKGDPLGGDSATVNSVRLKALIESANSLADLLPTVFTHIGSSDEAEMSALEEKLSSHQEQMLQSLPVASGGDSASQIEGRTHLSEIKSTLRKITQLSRLDTNNRSAALSLNESKLAGDEIMKRTGELDQLLGEEARAGREESQNSYQLARWWILGVTLVGALAGAFVGYFITYTITRPVFEVRNLAQAMARGDLRQRTQLKQRDEVGELADATNTLADSLTTIVTEIQRVSSNVSSSAGDLSGVSHQLLGQSEQTFLQATNVASASEELSSNIGTMAAAAEEMSVSVASISSASEEMSMNVGTISSAAEQTSNNVNVVSTAVEEISRSFNDVLADVREGSRVAGDARRMADSATETIQQLNQSGAEISKVTETIKMIALQTNLLALNATIEATSAGDAGKGFAVVAHEIKELANQSAKAAEDIARKIEGVQRDTRQAVDVIQNVSQIIKDINASTERISDSVESQTRAATMISQNVGEANKGVGDIARSIAEVAKAAGDMSRNVAEAARGATDVSRNVSEAAKAAGGISSSIHSVSGASRSTSESANQVNSSAAQLDRIGQELRRLVGRFKVNADEALSEPASGTAFRDPPRPGSAS